MTLKHKKYILSVSYGNYVTGVGGTDKVIMAHEKLFCENEISTVYIYPIKRINSRLAVKRNDIWGLIIDGVSQEIYSSVEIQRLLISLESQSHQLLNIFVHHLKNVDVMQLSNILNTCDTKIFFYLHDYMSICPNGGLIKNDNIFCGAEKPNPKKCADCKFFENTNSRLNEIENFFKKYKDRITYISPSHTAKNTWVEYYKDYIDKVEVIYHQMYSGEYLGNMELISEDEPLKIAFVGYQKELKGWNYWKNAVDLAHNSNAIQKYYQYGTCNENFLHIEEVKIDFKNSLDAMTSALRENKIHCAVLWSLVPETYSYTFYETWAANSFILTNVHSGNIAEQVKNNNNGIVAIDVTALNEIFLDEKSLRDKINQYRSRKMYGPLKLKENDNIINYLDQSNNSFCKKDFTNKNKSIISYKILWNLNKLYNEIKN